MKYNMYHIEQMSDMGRITFKKNAFVLHNEPNISYNYVIIYLN